MSEEEVSQGISSRSASPLRRRRSSNSRLTWINYSDPVRERRRKDNQRVVRKAAKLSTLSPAQVKAEEEPETGTTSTGTRFAVRSSSIASSRLSHSPPSAGGQGNDDPFHSLPVHVDAESLDLLKRYLNTVHFRPGCPTRCQRTQDLRRRYLLPTLLQSKGTLSVALLHLERDWKMGDDARHQTFQTFHQTSAIAEARRALEHPETLVAIEMFTVIAKLAKAAHFQYDHIAVNAHYNGMAQLFMHHWDALAAHPLFTLGIFCFWFRASEMTTCCVERANKADAHTAASTSSGYDLPVSGSPVLTAFQHLHRMDFISIDTLDALPDLYRLAHLFDQAATHALHLDDARHLLRLMWRCPAHLQKLEASTSSQYRPQFEQLIWLTLKFVLTLCVNPSMSCVAEYSSPVMQRRINELDLTMITSSCPETLLWILLVSGSCCTPATQQSLALTLRLLTNQLGIASYDNAALYARQYIWSERLDDSARTFWMAAHGSNSSG